VLTSSDKTDVFRTRTKKKVEKRISFFTGHEVLFYETTFSASALEHCANHATTEAADWVDAQANR
jgi:hypothetical protein